MKCTVCGTENPDNAKFCGMCGNPFADTPKADNEPDPDTSAAAAADTVTAEAPADSGEATDSFESYADYAVFASPVEPSSKETADVNATDGQPEAQAAPAPLPAGPNKQVYSNSGYGSSFTPPENPIPPQNNNAGGHENKKEKKVVSLSVAVFCIVAVFILSIACGVLAQLYIRKSSSPARSDTVYSSHKASEDTNSRTYCGLSGSEGSVYFA